ncbi:MAG TPA: hypothetical protein VGQ81_12105 [Acidobacteriota bacterium]|nr:hypothetical protein [Acidobacteriota bacterium]
MQKAREASLTAPTVAFTYRPPSQPESVQHPKRSWIPRWAFASGAIAAMVLIVAVVGVRLVRPAMMLQDGKVRITNEKTGLRISGVPGQFEAMVGEKLPPGGEPQLLAPLTPVPKILGPDSDSKALVIGVKRPFPDEVFAEPRVEIQWSSPQNGVVTRIRIYQEGADEKPFWEQVTSATSATVSLKPGAAYVVVISGEQGTHAIYSPAIRFRVLDEGEVGAMRELLATAGDSHLLKGIYYEKHGLFTKALDEYSALQKSSPRSPLARRIFTELSQALTPP